MQGTAAITSHIATYVRNKIRGHQDNQVHVEDSDDIEMSEMDHSETTRTTSSSSSSSSTTLTAQAAVRAPLSFQGISCDLGYIAGLADSIRTRGSHQISDKERELCVRVTINIMQEWANSLDFISNVTSNGHHVFDVDENDDDEVRSSISGARCTLGTIPRKQKVPSWTPAIERAIWGKI